MKKEKAKKNN